ncbi:MAG: triose-phosphate isomerase [Pseudomonadota bacterium]|nr:triose-phosphate isomerase [Pseudomonadota bacterium]
MTRRKLVAGNWKMNGTSTMLSQVTAISMAAETHGEVDVALCIPATLIERATHSARGFAIGGQDVHAEANGAFTGDISAQMLTDAGAKLVIVGHSERREEHGETDAGVKAKAEAALAAGLGVILCVGESDAVRGEGRAVAHVGAQLDASLPFSIGDPARFSVAYEPIWAIGTGKVAGVIEIGEMHAALRARLVAAYGELGEAVRILYGGSVKASNAAEIFAVPDVDGALVGGASLSNSDFEPIIAAAR